MTDKTKEITVTLSEDELYVIQLAWECIRDGLIETGYNTDGLQRISETATKAFGESK